MNIAKMCQQYSEDSKKLETAIELNPCCFKVFYGNIPIQEMEDLITNKWPSLCDATDLSWSYGDLRDSFYSFKLGRIDYSEFRESYLHLKKAVSSRIEELRTSTTDLHDKLIEAASRFFLAKSHDKPEAFAHQFFYCALAHPDAAESLLEFMKSDFPKET